MVNLPWSSWIHWRCHWRDFLREEWWRVNVDFWSFVIFLMINLKGQSWSKNLVHFLYSGHALFYEFNKWASNCLKICWMLAAPCRHMPTLPWNEAYFTPYVCGSCPPVCLDSPHHVFRELQDSQTSSSCLVLPIPPNKYIYIYIHIQIWYFMCVYHIIYIYIYISVSGQNPAQGDFVQLKHRCGGWLASCLI